MMGTNFYFTINPKTIKKWIKWKDEDDIDKHIGKITCAGLNKTKFIMTDFGHKDTLLNLTHSHPELKVCEDEYCTEFTAQEMLNEINGCDFITENKCKFF